MAAPVINTPAHLEHRIKTPDGRTLAVAEWGDPDGLPSYAGSPSRACACTTAWATGSPLTGTSNVPSVWGRASRTAKTPGVLTGNQRQCSDCNSPHSAKSNDRRYGGHFVLRLSVWWATLDSNQ
jgi:hypothetical protein